MKSYNSFRKSNNLTSHSRLKLIGNLPFISIPNGNKIPTPISPILPTILKINFQIPTINPNQNGILQNALVDQMEISDLLFSETIGETIKKEQIG